MRLAAPFSWQLKTIKRSLHTKYKVGGKKEKLQNQ
jgi:hypothetical protein